MHEELEEQVGYEVVVNDEEQYSIWPTGRELPCGWHKVGHVGDKASCLGFITAVWTDMRPKSLRQEMSQ
jgi:MbtH protein